MFTDGEFLFDSLGYVYFVFYSMGGTIRFDGGLNDGEENNVCTVVSHEEFIHDLTWKVKDGDALWFLSV